MLYYRRRREITYLATEDEIHFNGEIEVDESYFGGRRKGKRGRGGKVYTKIIPNAKATTLMLIIQRKVIPE